MSIATVGRIAYLTSEVIINSLPPPPAASVFAKSFLDAGKTSVHKPKVVSSPSGADDGQTILWNTSNLTTLTALANSQALIRLLPYLGELSASPIVIHIAVDEDLSNVLLLRSSVPFFLLSTTPQKAHDNAVLAARLARVERKAVVHAFFISSVLPSEELAEEQLHTLLFVSKPSSQSQIDGNADGHLDLSTVLLRLYEDSTHQVSSLIKRPLDPLTSQGSANPERVLLLLGKGEFVFDIEGVLFVSISLVTPLHPTLLLNSIPVSANRVIVLEQIHKWHSKWTPVYLDVLIALRERTALIVQYGEICDLEGITKYDVENFIRSSIPPLSTRLRIGSPSTATKTSPSPPHVPKHETSYTKILTQLFQDSLEVANGPELVATQGPSATTPEFALGRVRGHLESRAELVSSVQELLQDREINPDLRAVLTKWILAKDDSLKSRDLGIAVIETLKSTPPKSPAAQRIISFSDFLPSRSRWIIGSDAWSYDLGSSGLHHVIASGLDLNMLILETTPYSSRNAVDPHRRKHDIGLYAMNHGDVYVASVAVFSSYSQVLQAIVEADKFKGPSVVLAYLPYTDENTPAIEILKETKLSVDSGYWPLYRWDPSKEKAGKEPFSLDSEVIKNELKHFLDRQNHLSQLVRSTPQLASELVSSLGQTIRDARRKRAQDFNSLVSSLDAPPILVLYASDGGAAEKKAKRLAGRAKARGLTTSIATMDSYTPDTLTQEEVVVFVTSTAGQGEPPQNGRTFFKTTNAAVAKGDKIFQNLRYCVFGMGDSHYWPRPEDAHYYNKPGKDLDVRLEKLGAERIASLGLGDDQDADGSETGYKIWEPLLWKALNVDSVEVTEAEPEPITNEHIKAASGYLRGTISEGLQDYTTGALAASDTQLTKFHGIYQQDDRDIRDERQSQGAEPAYSFMIRVRMPGGVCKPDQWLQMDQLADEHGCGTFKITTRQTFQFHGVIKKHLKPAIQDINRVLLDTLAACGDVNRNVICSAIPTLSKIHSRVYEFCKEVSEHLLPRTSAYHEIWLDKKLVAGEAVKDVEPVYGEFYLPRKFKIAVAVPPTNDVDVFTNDVGFIAIVNQKGELEGFNVTIGGGMGVTHGNKKTYPRLGSLIGFCTPDQGKYVAEKIMIVQRDHGNRVDRKNARLKYTVDRMGLENYKKEVEKLLGYPLAPDRPFTFDRNVDDFGWHSGEDGKHHFVMFIENGRVQDEPGKDFKTGLREIAKVHKGTFRLTANQHLVLSDIAPADLGSIKDMLRKYNLDQLQFSGLRLSSSACVAFPTCGLAMAESERYLPLLIDKVEKICEENGLRNDSIVMRMTGCPNGCARPYVAEIAFVGKAPGTYSMLLGGGFHGQRLNKIYRDSVNEHEILSILRPMIKRYALECHAGEKFGDWTIRAGYITATTEGRLWYEGAGGESAQKTVTDLHLEVAIQ